MSTSEAAFLGTHHLVFVLSLQKDVRVLSSSSLNEDLQNIFLFPQPSNFTTLAPLPPPPNPEPEPEPDLPRFMCLAVVVTNVADDVMYACGWW